MGRFGGVTTCGTLIRGTAGIFFSVSGTPSLCLSKCSDKEFREFGLEKAEILTESGGMLEDSGQWIRRGEVTVVAVGEVKDWVNPWRFVLATVRGRVAVEVSKICGGLPRRLVLATERGRVAMVRGRAFSLGRRGRVAMEGNREQLLRVRKERMRRHANQQ